MAGRWESVLQVTQSLTLPNQVGYELMSQVILELAEAGEAETARAITRGATVMQEMKQNDTERFLHLDHIVTRAQSGLFDGATMWPHGREAKRKELVALVTPCVTVVPPSRLLALLTQSLKYQQLVGALPRGARFDLLHGGAPTETVVTAEAYPTKNSRVVKFAEKSYPECARFAPDGLILASGSCDGYIELWDATTGKLNLEFAYQADDQLMSHDSAVLCLAFSMSMELLVSGSAKGEIKVWRIATGSCVRKLPTAHSEGVTQVEFMRDGTSVLSSSFDGLMRLHGLKSGRMLKEFRGHTSFVTGFTVVDELPATSTVAGHGERILSTSADGTIRVWDLKTQDCLRVIKFQSGAAGGGLALSLLGITQLPATQQGAERFILIERSNTIRIIDADGNIIHSLQSTSTSTSSTAKSSATPATSASKKKLGGDTPLAAGDFVCATVSPKGKYLYGVTEECVLHCFELSSNGAGKLVHAIKIHRADAIGIAHHPHQSILASYSQEGNIKLWTP